MHTDYFEHICKKSAAHFFFFNIENVIVLHNSIHGQCRKTGIFTRVRQRENKEADKRTIA